MGLRRGRRPGTAAAVWRSDDGDSLAHGVLVDTRIVARVLRVPLLRLEGVVVLSPMSAARDDNHPVVMAAPAPLVVGRSPASDGRAIGDGLADVAQTLARLRASGSNGRPKYLDTRRPGAGTETAR